MGPAIIFQTAFIWFLGITPFRIRFCGTQWNKIEHRLFPFITQNWRAKPLVSYRVIVELRGATTTQTGLTVRCELDDKTYPKGIVVSDAQMQDLNISHDTFHGEWNYTIALSSTPPIKAVDS